MTTIVNRPQIQLPLSRQYSEAISEGADGNLRVPSHDPTPLIGRWADESFPLNSRQASELITNAIAAAEGQVQRQRSSIVFQDEQGNEFSYADEEDPETTSQVEIDDKHSQERNSELAEAHSTDDMSIESPTHVSRCYKYDPYNLNAGVDIIYCCYCDQCVALLHGGVPAVSPSNLSMVSAPQSVAAAPQIEQPQPQHHLAAHAPRPLGVSPDSHNTSFAQTKSDEWDAPRPAYPAPPAHHQVPTAAPRGFATHLNSRPVAPSTVPAVTMQNRQTQGPQLSSFMPPPPPPRIMTLVLEEEGNRAASSVFFHVLTRWYNHVIEAQEFFTAPEDYCPPPNKELYSFDEWADRVSGWWYTHFEHRQKKPSRFVAPFPQGGARGTGYGPM